MVTAGNAPSLGPALSRLADAAAELVGARYAVLSVVDPERGLVDALFTAGPGAEELRRAARRPAAEAGLAGQLLRNPRPLVLREPTDDPRVCGLRADAPRPGGFLGLPLRVAEEVFGNLYLARTEGGAFSGDEVRLLTVLAAQAGIAIGNARLQETARLRERWIEGAAAVTNTLLAERSAADALTTVAEQARVLADAAAGVVLTPTGDGGMEITAASAPRDPEGLVGTTILPGSPVLVQLLGGEPVFIEDSATDPRMTTAVRTRFGPSMMLPLQSGGRLVGTLALPRRRYGRPYTELERQLAARFASQAALALVLAGARADRERLAVFEDRDRIARDLHDLVVQRLFATEMMLESTRRRATEPVADELLARAVDELDSTVQEVRTAIFALQQPPADASATFRGRVLRETAGAAALLGFSPSVRFTGAVDALVGPESEELLLSGLRGALAAAHRRPGVSRIEVEVDATAALPSGGAGVRLRVYDDGLREDGTRGTESLTQAPRAEPPDGV
ncbi:sensor histidine kinase [Streptomyces sp. C10-9-1]|uniref:sensor histidine kinase n=1 Tax=Streptomyces sp. C10-9-1 TaxID=1859285 RepID=UPI003F4A14E9